MLLHRAFARRDERRADTRPAFVAIDHDRRKLARPLRIGIGVARRNHRHEPDDALATLRYEQYVPIMRRANRTGPRPLALGALLTGCEVVAEQPGEEIVEASCVDGMDRTLIFPARRADCRFRLTSRDAGDYARTPDSGWSCQSGP